MIQPEAGPVLRSRLELRSHTCLIAKGLVLSGLTHACADTEVPRAEGLRDRDPSRETKPAPEPGDRKCQKVASDSRRCLELSGVHGRGACRHVESRGHDDKILP